MSDLPKLPTMPAPPFKVVIVPHVRKLPTTPRVPMRPSDFAGFTEEGRACFARILRRAIERNRKAAP